MRDSTYRLTLDIHDVASQVQITAKQNDNARKIIFALMENGKPYPLTDYCSAVFMMKKPNGTVLYNDCDIINSGSAISYDFTSQTTASLGICECELRVYDAVNTLITSPRFTILVSSTVYQDGQVTSSSEYSALTTALSQVSEAKEAFEEEVPKVEALIARETQTLNQAQTYANNSQTYSNNALTYANNASASASASSSSATLSTSEANRSKAEADRSKSEADRAFHTTPEGYDALVNKVNNNDIFTSDYSPSLTLTTGKGGLGVKGIKGGSHKSKNLIKPTLTSQTLNGVTITNNGDGTYTFNGTSSGNISSIQFQSNISLRAGTYKYLGCPSGGNNNTYSLRIGSVAPSDVGNGQTFTLSSDTVVNIYPVIISGTVCNNLVFKPMLTTDTTVTYADYEPYGIVNAGQMGCVDLGDLSWEYVSTTNYKGFVCASISNAKDRFNWAISRNYARNSIGNYSITSSTDKSCGYIFNTQFIIRDDSYTDAASFKSAMQGILLAYELADGQSADEYALVVSEHNEGSSLSDNLIIPLDSPICRVGNVADEICEQNGVGGVLRKFGSVDLGSLSWQYNSSNAFFYADVSGISQRTDMFIAIADGYTNDGLKYTGEMGSASNLTFSKNRSGANNTVLFKNTSYSTTSAFASAMNGVKLIYEKATPTFEPFSDQTVMLRLKSYSGKTYVTTQEGLAELSLRYSKSDVGAESLNKYIYDDKQISSELDDVQFLGWRVPKDCPIKNYKDKNGSYHQIVGRVDLGSLTWTFANNTYFYAPFDTGLALVSNIKRNDIYCSKYKNSDANGINNGDKVITDNDGYLSGAKRVYIHDSSYNNATTFKSAMSGIYLYYQLSTEVVYPCGQENASSLSDEWNKSVTYAINDFVIYKNALWKCKAQNSNTVPSESAYWTKTTFAKEIKALYGLV